MPRRVAPDRPADVNVLTTMIGGPVEGSVTEIGGQRKHQRAAAVDDGDGVPPAPRGGISIVATARVTRV